MRRLFAGLVAFFALSAVPVPIAAAASQTTPEVAVSIQPAALIAGAVMEGLGTPALIVPGTASEHTYALKPSDARLVQDADLLVWFGPSLEGYLVRPLAARPKGRKTLPLLDVSGLKVLPLREGGAFEAHDHSDHGHADHGHAQKETDAHAWLDPRNAVLMAKAIETALAALDPANAARYAANVQAFESRVSAMDADIAQRLAPAKGKRFIVFHDAYQYFEARYGLAAAGSILLDPEESASAQRLKGLRDKIAKEGAVCVFSETQSEPKLVTALIEGTAARTGVLDPLGATTPGGATPSYESLMRGLAGAFAACLVQ